MCNKGHTVRQKFKRYERVSKKRAMSRSKSPGAKANGDFGGLRGGMEVRVEIIRGAMLVVSSVDSLVREAPLDHDGSCGVYLCALDAPFPRVLQIT